MPSIRGRGPHTVIVQNRKNERINGYSQWSSHGEPVRIRNCSVQSVREWATAEEIPVDGLQLLSMRRVFAREWPGDVNSLVYFEGGKFETVGDPQKMDGSRRTHHWVITIRWICDEDPPNVPLPAPNEGGTP